MLRPVAQSLFLNSMLKIFRSKLGLKYNLPLGMGLNFTSQNCLKKVAAYVVNTDIWMIWQHTFEIGVKGPLQVTVCELVYKPEARVE